MRGCLEQTGHAVHSPFDRSGAHPPHTRFIILGADRSYPQRVHADEGLMAVGRWSIPWASAG